MSTDRRQYADEAQDGKEAGSTPELKVPKELLDELVTGPMTQADLETMFRTLKKAVIELTIRTLFSRPD